MKILGISLLVSGLIFLVWTGFLMYHALSSDLITALTGLAIGLVFLFAGMEAAREGTYFCELARRYSRFKCIKGGA